MSSKPIRPEVEDCCGSGCSPCVFDVYEEQLKLWEANKQLPQEDIVFNSLKYSPFLLSTFEKLTPDTVFCNFQAVNDDLQLINSKIKLKMGDYIILRSSSTEFRECTSRPYTPILNDALKSGSFQVIIKLYENGKMSQILRKAKLGDVFHCRGPYNHFKYRKTRHIILLGAGTGIVPIYNISSEIVLNDQCETIVKVIGCFSSVQCILMRKELHELSAYWNCHVQFFISRDDSVNQIALHRERIEYSKLTTQVMEQIVFPFVNKDVLFVACGSDSFNEFCKNCLRSFADDQIVIL